MSFPDFVFRVAHGYPGKVPALAARMAKNVTTLQNKLNPNYPSHGINADEIEQILDLSDSNKAAAEFFAAKVGCVVFQPSEQQCSDIELLDAFMQVLQELGEFSAEFKQDFSDGNISQEEFDRIVKESDDVIARLLELRSRIGQLVSD